ncbi:MAG: Mu transposase C-terminal domain-containing protein [Desulfotignum sp.]|nr:Mu transposase C-terminal domain-containing protein [Desulfotignum sp.]
MEPEVTINTIHSALSAIEPVGLTTVKRRAARERWYGRESFGAGRGGRTVMYTTSLLPADVQAALNVAFLSEVTDDNLPALPQGKQGAVCHDQEKRAMAKTELAAAYVRRLESAGYGRKKKEKQLFIDNYNLGDVGLMPHIYAVIGSVDLNGKTIHGWVSKLKKHGWDPMCLVDRRGYHCKGKRSVTREQMRVILSIVQSPYNVPGKPVMEIINQAIMIMDKRGINTLSATTYRRWLTDDWIPYHYDQWIWWREGEKGLNDKVLYNLIRDYDKIEPGDVLVADGHVLNFEIINPLSGKPKRMMLVLFQDMKSSYPLGWEIMPTENTQAISSALRRAILRLGKIPKIVYIDNGRAFKGKYFTDTDFELEFKGLYHRLSIRLVVAWAYHGQSKPVERFFKEFAELERWAPSYIGTSIDNKPAHMNRGEVLRRKLHDKITGGAVPTIEEAHRSIAIWFDKYCDTPQGPNSHLAGQTPSQVMVPGPGVDPVELRCLMMESKSRLVRQNGVNLFGTNSWYYAPELYGRRHTVICKYDLQDQDSVLVYDEKTGEFICEAFKVAKVHPMASLMGNEADKAEYERQIALKNSGRKYTVASAREIVETQVLPETRKRITAAGFSLTGESITRQVGTRPAVEKEKKPAPMTQAEIDQIQAQVDAIEFDTGCPDEAVCDRYEPVVEDEASQIFGQLKHMPEPDRFEKLIEMEIRGILIPAAEQSWMAYFEKTSDYARLQDYFEEHRTKMVLLYGSESTKTGT